MQAPLALTPGTVERTAILVRWPASRAIAAISTVPSAISGHLQREQLPHQVRVGARQRHLRAAEALGDTATTYALEPLAVLVLLARDLLGRRQHRLDLAEVDQHDAVLGPALVRLDDAGDDVALAADVLAEVTSSSASRSRCRMTCLAVIAAIRPKSCGVSSNSRSTVPSSSSSWRPDRDRAGLAVDLDPGVRLAPSVCRYAVSSAVSIASTIVSNEISFSRSRARSAAMSMFTVLLLRVRRPSPSSAPARLNSTCTRAAAQLGVAVPGRPPSTSSSTPSSSARGDPARHGRAAEHRP